VTEADGFGIRGGDRNTITNDGTIVVDGANGVAIDVQDDVDADPPTADPAIVNNGSIVLNGDGAVGIRSNDNVNLLNASTGTITVTGAGGTAMQGRDDNFLQNLPRAEEIHRLVKSAGLRLRYWMQARSDSISAWVPEPTPTACRTPIMRASSASRASVSGPSR